MHTRIFRQLGMERGNEESPFPQEDGLAVVLRQHLDVLPTLPQPRRANEDSPQRLSPL